MGRLREPSAEGEFPRVLGQGSSRGEGKQKLRPLDLEKTRRQLEMLAEACLATGSQAQKVAFLVLPGLFDPVNVAHLSILQRAQEIVASRGLPVVGGFLAPLRAADAELWPATLMGSKAQVEPSGPLPLPDRGALCEAACEGSEWLAVCNWGWDSSPRVTDRMRQQLTDRLGWTGGVCWDFEGWWIVGSSSDLHRHLQRGCRPVVCVSPRGDADPFLTRALALAAGKGCGKMASAPAAVVAARHRAFGLSRSEGFRSAALLVRGRQPEVPEAELRALTSAGDWEAVSKRCWLPTAVLRRLRQGSEQAPEAAACPEEDAEAEPVSAPPAQAPVEPPPAAASASAGGRRERAGGRRAKVHFTTGDAAKASQCGGHKIIAHVCNDQGNGGRGFFQAVKSEWGLAASRAYFEWHRDRGHGSGFRLGAVQFVRVGPLVEVANMIGKQGSKEGSKGSPVKQAAVEEALRAVAWHAAESGASVHLPMASGGGPGMPREQLEPLLKAVSAETGAAIYVYK